MSIGERISDLRKSKNISQEQLARYLGVSRQAVSKWENDLSSPDTLNLIKLADLLDTEVAYLATGQKPVYTHPVYVDKVKVVERQVPVPVEKIVEVPVPVERIVEVEKIVEHPVIQKVVRYRYVRSPIEFLLVGSICLAAGILIGWLFF